MSRQTKDQELEYEIQNKGLNAPRLNPAKIDSVINKIDYIVLPCGRTTICQLTLMNGYSVTGESAAVSKENFDEQIGRKIAFENARDKIWALEGYLLKQKLYEKETK
jgi:hypothetical protein